MEKEEFEKENTRTGLVLEGGDPERDILDLQECWMC